MLGMLKSAGISAAEAKMIAGAGFGLGAGGGYHKLSPDHGLCKDSPTMGNNTREWVVGSCSDAG
eukprot:2268957-Rhodomonas_salina.1